jgi:hypothetical protein
MHRRSGQGQGGDREEDRDRDRGREGEWTGKGKWNSPFLFYVGLRNLHKRLQNLEKSAQNWDFRFIFLIRQFGGLTSHGLVFFNS